MQPDATTATGAQRPEGDGHARAEGTRQRRSSRTLRSAEAVQRPGPTGGIAATLPSCTKAVRCDISARAFQHLTDVDQMARAAEDPDALLWLDLLHPSEDEIERLGAKLGLHPLAIEDAAHGHQRPKIEEYEGFFFLVFYAITPPETRREPSEAAGDAAGDAGAADVQPDTLNTCEVRMFVGKRYLVTIHDAPLDALDEAERRWTRNSDQVEWGVGVLLYSLLDTIVDGYFPTADALVDATEDLDERLYSAQQQRRDPRFTIDLLSLKRTLLEFRRLVAPERDVLNVLTNRDSPVFNERTLVYFRDVHDHLNRLADTLDLYRDQLGSTMDASLALASNDLNTVMRTLTAWSIILMTGALIAGIYGMNFVIIPELHWTFGYPYALGLMAVTGGALWYYFKRRRWF